MLTLLALAACAAPPAATPPPAASGHVQLPASAVPGDGGERGRMRSALDASAAALTPCYSEAVQRDPAAYGALVVRLALDAEGGVTEVLTELSTLGDPAFDACAVAVLAARRFPPPNHPGLTLRYPYVFTTALTPPEVTRALLIRHGYLAPEPLPTDPLELENTPAPKGSIETW
ncbi:MAG: energy transducer TonB [Alphaproteobacteria bacterium]|nr:energy transducer TonB [Alphaproteobacteria bacterium]